MKSHALVASGLLALAFTQAQVTGEVIRMTRVPPQPGAKKP